MVLKRWSIVTVILLSAALCSCALHKESKITAPAAQEAGNQLPDSAPASAPSATIQISYAHPDDYTESLTVTKFSGARLILIRHRGDNSTASVVRFEGGKPVWEIKADQGVGGSLLEHVPGLDPAHRFALKSVTYGQMPANFMQVAPDSGSPEPLEASKYYIFSVTRGSGTQSYQAVRVEADGSVSAYDAEPRAGTSYELCCNLPRSFEISEVQP